MFDDCLSASICGMARWADLADRMISAAGDDAASEIQAAPVLMADRAPRRLPGRLWIISTPLLEATKGAVLLFTLPLRMPGSLPASPLL